MLAPIAWRTPPKHYGPWESIASLLTEGLVARGVDVTLFATLDSVTAAALDGVCPHGYAEDAQLDGRVWEAMHVSHALARSGEFDLVHNHLDWLPLAFGEHARAPMVTTIHGFSGAGILPAYTRSRSAFVAISDSDRYAGLDYAATIHHGIDLTMFPYRDARGDYLVSFGRIHPDKGTADAIEIARRAGRRLVICGIVQDDRYFADAVAPHVDGQSGHLPRPRSARGAARMSSAMRLRCCTRSTSTSRSACPSWRPWRAIPVVAYRRGSMPEVIDEGVTGYLAHDIESSVDAVRAAVRLDRSTVHARAVVRFGADRMVDEYLRIYEALLMSASISPSGA